MAQFGRNGKDEERGAAPARGRAISIADPAIWRAMRSPLRFQLLEAVRSAPCSTARALASALGTTVPRLHYHLRILIDAGLLLAESGGPLATDATRYSARFERFPKGFFLEGDESSPRRAAYVRMLTAQGLKHAVAPPSRNRARRVDPSEAPVERRLFSRLERLGSEDLRDVLHHAEQIRRIVERARDRRDGGGVASATHFVGVCVTPLRSPALPDAPLD